MYLPLPQVRVGEPVRCGTLAVYPLFAEQRMLFPNSALNYLLSDEATAVGTCQITETGTISELIVDNACMQLVMRPETFDVLVLPNLYGDIISDLAAGLVGGLGLVPGANLGLECAIFEAVHGSAPDIAGKGIANPTAMILSAKMMLEHLGLKEEAASLESAVAGVYRKGSILTLDQGGTSSTLEFAEAVLKNIN